MKLLTHNLLKSPVKGALTGYPLGIEVSQVESRDVEFNPEFLVRMVDRLDWSVLYAAASALGVAEGLPDSRPPHVESQEDVLRALHHALMEIEIIEGQLICPDTGRKFPIKRGIPNMLVTEDEA
eukprot:m.8849 g.8849  ORF g.8849 m.8849 type:complete len:124 (+) comp5403_c0_seq1:105-476(+)